MGDYCNQGKDYSDMIVHLARVMSVINDVQTNRVCALSITLTSYFCLNTAQYIHIIEYSECFITDARVCWRTL